MYVFTDHRMYLFLLCVQCLCFILSQGKPSTPDIYYAVLSSTVELPCVSDRPGDKLQWHSKNRDGSLRTSSHKDKDGILLYVITSVRLSDAGTFYCSDGSQISNLQLVVVDPSPVRDTEAKITVPDEIKITWKAPLKTPQAVRSYNIYVKELGQSDKEVKVPVDDVSPDEEEEFDFTDFIPGATYEIQVAPVYIKGAEDVGERIEGPRSPKVRIKTPKIDASSWKVKAEPGKNSSILVTWQPPRDVESRDVDGYIVRYKAIGKKDAPSGNVTVRWPDEDGRWSAVLRGLKTRMKYKIDVIAFTGASQQIPGGKSQEITIAHDGFNPELSIRALPLGPDTVLLTLDTVGGDKVEKLRLFYSDKSAIDWTKVEDYNTKEKYAVVTGLQPRTRYFFMAKAAVNKKARSIVTHLMTPPPALSTPTNVSVTATSDTSVQVTWGYDGRVPALGFIVLVEKMQPEGGFRPDKQQVVFKVNEADVPELDSGEKYQVKVEPFDVEGVGSCSDPSLFQLGGAGETPSPVPEREPPYFVEEPPEAVHINEDDNVQLSCTALGRPEPTVQWYQNNVPVGQPGDRRSQLTLSRVRESTVLTCRASNEVGTADRQTIVHVTPRLEVPRLDELPKTVIVNRGQDLQQSCSATGYPEPTITWYRNGTLVRSTTNVPGRSDLIERRILRPLELKCVASNSLGSAEAVIQVFVQERPPQSDYQVTLREISEPPSVTKLKWIVDRGNLRDIRHFDVKLTTERGEIVHIQRLGSDKRSINLRFLTPRSRYIFNLLTWTSRDMVDNSTIAFIPDFSPPSNTEPVIHLNVVEIRDNEALVDYSAKNFDPLQIASCRLRVKDLDVGNLGNIILDISGQPLEAYTVVQNMKPYRNYQVIVDAVSRNGHPILGASASFSTAGPGKYGIPVFNTSPQEPATTADVSTVITRRTRPTVPPRTFPPKSTSSMTPTWTSSMAPTWTSSMAPTWTSTMAPTWTSSMAPTLTSTMAPKVESSTLETPEEDYFMTVRIPFKSPHRVDVRWTVERGPLENIQDFLVTFKGERGQTLLTQTLPADQRYISVQPLNPNTQYFVNVKANGPEGVLADSDVAFQTYPVDFVPETSNPVLELEANEVRGDNVKLVWTLVGAKPNLVKNYRLRVLDGGPDGMNLLNREVHADSQSLHLQKLQPNTRYHVIAEALAENGTTLLTTALTFETASPKKNGIPVQSSSKAAANPGKNTRSAQLAAPVLELEVRPEGDTSANLRWNLQNVPVRAVSGYTLNVRNNGPDGKTVLGPIQLVREEAFRLDGLATNRVYYLELEAVSPSGSTIARAATPYTPGRSNPPFKVTSRESDGAQPADVTPENTDKAEKSDEAKPEIDLELNPVGQDQVRVNWSVVGGSSSRPIMSYNIKVKEDGSTVHENRLRANTAYYTVSGLQPNTNYHIQLDALDSEGRVIENVSSPYLVPPPGFSVEPIRTSSVFKTPPTTKAPNYDRGPDNSDLVITKAQVEGPDVIFLEWFDVTSSNGVPSRDTMVRYAELLPGNTRGKFQMERVQPGQGKLFIRNLKPKTTYWIQVASMGSSSQSMRWSKFVLRVTK